MKTSGDKIIREVICNDFVVIVVVVVAVVVVVVFLCVLVLLFVKGM